MTLIEIIRHSRYGPIPVVEAIDDDPSNWPPEWQDQWRERVSIMVVDGRADECTAETVATREVAAIMRQHEAQEKSNDRSCQTPTHMGQLTHGQDQTTRDANIRTPAETNRGIGDIH